MRVVTEDQLDELSGSERYWAYNAMDCAVTREVADVLRPMLTQTTEKTYRFEMALQAPAMAMMLRGLGVDQPARARHISEVKGRIVAVAEGLQSRVAPWWTKIGKVPAQCVKGGKHKWPRSTRRKIEGKWVIVKEAPPEEEQRCEKCACKRLDIVPFEPTSHQQVKRLLYEDMGLPRMFNKTRKVSVDKECLERLARRKPKHAELILEIRAVRLLDKLRSILESPLDPDGRWRYSLNIGATETGRPSSSESPMRTGSNTQNIPEQMRDMFVSDPGWVMFNVDLTTAESNFVAHRSGDEGYIEAHKSGDVHTMVCRDIWPDLPWTGDLARDKEVAETNPPWSPDPGHTYRFHGKRRQHGGNYGMTAFGMAMRLRIKVAQAQRDIEQYFKRFPRIPMWQRWVREQVRETGVITTVLGMRRQFFGRGWDEHTIREAIAFEPQSVIAVLVEIAMWHIWKELDPGVVRLFQNGYDSLLGQVRERDAEWALGRIKRHMTLALDVPDIEGQVRRMVIPAEVKIGRNWGKFHAEKNPQGMRSWIHPGT